MKDIKYQILDTDYKIYSKYSLDKDQAFDPSILQTSQIQVEINDDEDHVDGDHDDDDHSDDDDVGYEG